MSDKMYIFVWVILYVCLFESIRIFSHLMRNYISGFCNKEKIAVFALEGVLYIIALILLITVNAYDILTLVVFGALMLGRIIAAAIKRKNAGKSAVLLLILLASPLLLQAFAGIIPYAVVIEHILLCGALCVTFSISLSEKT